MGIGSRSGYRKKTPLEHETYVLTNSYEGQFWSLISGHIYLTLAGFETARKILRQLRERGRGCATPGGLPGAFIAHCAGPENA
ncbi:hypothetical protein DL768_010252 [Monosporascus sp. mg162]|nr:hypothetical protein DL768_010252 [Monosporascus sp. mg162]